MCDDCNEVIKRIKDEDPGIVIGDATHAAMTSIRHWAFGWRKSATSLVRDIDDRWGDMGVIQMYRVWCETEQFLPLPDDYKSPFRISSLVITEDGAYGPDDLPPELREKYNRQVQETNDEIEGLLTMLRSAATSGDTARFEEVLTLLDDDKPHHQMLPVMLLNEASARWDHATDEEGNPAYDQWEAHLKKYMPDSEDDDEVSKLRGLFDHE